MNICIDVLRIMSERCTLATLCAILREASLTLARFLTVDNARADRQAKHMYRNTLPRKQQQVGVNSEWVRSRSVVWPRLGIPPSFTADDDTDQSACPQ